MAQLSVEIIRQTGSVLGGYQQLCVTAIFGLLLGEQRSQRIGTELGQAQPTLRRQTLRQGARRRRVAFGIVPVGAARDLWLARLLPGIVGDRVRPTQFADGLWTLAFSG
jgi:hypothetical protein